MKTSSAKAKGRALQNYVRDKLRTLWVKAFGLEDDDITSRQMGGSGTDIVLTPRAKHFIPYDIECKAHESLNVWKAWEQAKQNTASGRKTLLVIKRNRSSVLAVVELDEILK